jgi:hypothetical protein
MQMPDSGALARRSRARRRALRLGVVALTVVWFAILLALVPASSRALALPRALGTAAFTPTPTPCTPTPPTTCTPTPPTSPTVAPTNPPATATTSRPTATTPPPPPPSNNGGGPAAQGTRVILSQPTLGSAGASSASDLSPEDLSSNGLTIFAALGCILGVLGLIAVAITSITLVSDGWGPLVKVVLLGNRRGRRRFERKPQRAREARAAPAMRSRADWR